jgi:putative ABC transport system substrate-binding protein
VKAVNHRWRKIFYVALSAVLFALCSSAEAQQTGKVFRIGFLDSSTASGSVAVLDVFRQELSKFGWIDGKNIIFEYRFAEQKPERLPELAADLVRLKLNLIVAVGRAPVFAAKNATTTIPIVMTGFPDPVAEGIVASLARPGGNITGFSNLANGLTSKRLEILKDTVPKLTRVGALRQAGGPAAGAPVFNDLRAAAPILNLKLDEIESEADAKGLANAFQTAKQKQVGALLIGGGSRFLAERKRIVELAVKHRLPASYPQKEFVGEGGLMSYGADPADLYQRAAVYVDKILRGAHPADLSVQQATKFEFIVNLKAANQIGLTIPVRVLERANQVIK